MILWLVLFILVVAISFVLAYQSMRDFQEEPPENLENGIFLIRNPTNLTTEILKNLATKALVGDHTICLEKLFKGDKSALVIYGPTAIINQFEPILSTLELEDYTQKETAVLTWQIELRGGHPKMVSPRLSETEELWWQLCLRPDKTGIKGQVRVVAVSGDANRSGVMLKDLEDLTNSHILRIPRPFSAASMLKFYQNRAFDSGVKTQKFTPAEIIEML